jgi:hypothetical protein
MLENDWSVISGYGGRTVFVVEDREAWAYKEVGYEVVAKGLSNEEAQALCKLLKGSENGNR